MASSSVRIELLNKENYDTWKIHMEALLTKSDAWGYVSGEKPKPEANLADPAAIEAARLWQVEDSKAKSDLILAISPSELKQIKGCASAREVWLKLQTIYQSRGPARKATLLKRLTLHRMDDNGDVREHLREFYDVVDRLSEMGVEIDRDLLSVMMMYSLPPSFENFRCAIESRDELPTPEALRLKIVEESDARRNDYRNCASDAMLARKPLNRYRSTGHKDGGERKSEPREVRCYRCRKPGHKASQCNRDANPSGTNRVSFCALGAGNVDRGRWCLDSGCSAHMCKDSSEFATIREFGSERVNLANSASTDITGKGTVSIAAEANGRAQNVILEDALYVPDLRTNLLSVGKITDRGHKVVFGKKSARVLDRNGNVILIADRVGGLYYLRESVRETAASAKREREHGPGVTPLEIWHRRMGHLNAKDLIDCARKGYVQGLNIGKPGGGLKCEICLRGKMTTKPLPKQSSRASEPLEIIHSDVCGPMRTTSLGRARYFVTFIDDYSRWCEVRFLKGKNEVFNAFREFKAFAETMTGKRIKSLQSDNGTEYRNHAFDNFLKSNGIRRRLTVTHTPGQNGVAERRNRTLTDMARCMLIQSAMPRSFWAEAVNTANYTRNRCPSSSLGGKTAFEMWTGKVPSVKHLREFGCRVFVHDRSPGKGKFDPRSREGKFVGYSEQSKAYRVWLNKERKVEIARDVEFVADLGSRIGDPVGESRSPVDAERNQRGGDHIPEKGEAYREFDLEDAEVRTTHSSEEDPVETIGADRRSHEQDERQTQSREATRGTLRRGRGRPRIGRTGLRGRPRKLFQPVAENAPQPSEGESRSNAADRAEETAMAFAAEIPARGAMSGPERNEWKQAMAEEVRSIIKKDTWDVVGKSTSNSAIGSRFVLRNKYNADGSLQRRKARIVAQGFAQRPGVDFFESFAPVARLGSIRLVAALAAQDDMIVRQFDVSTAYLNGVLEETVFMKVPEFFRESLEEVASTEADTTIQKRARKMLDDIKAGDKVLRLKKALYGLRQAGRSWYNRLDRELKNLGAKPTSADPCVYRIERGEDSAILAVYVDDILIAARELDTIRSISSRLSKAFDMNDLGDVQCCVGIEFARGKEGIAINQKGYIRELMKSFGMQECNPVATPMSPGTRLERRAEPMDRQDGDLPYRELIGSLMYLAVATRPDIAHVVSYLSQFLTCYDKTHWVAAKRVLRYLKYTMEYCIVYRPTDVPMTGYADADWANCAIDRRSFTGYAFVLAGGPISWNSRKQRTVALSSTEAEYMALTEAAKEAVFLRKFLIELGFERFAGVTIYNDNMGASKLAENPVFHGRTKHIDVRHHFVRGALRSGAITLKHISTDEMPADVLTKALPRAKHLDCVGRLGLAEGIGFRVEGKCWRSGSPGAAQSE